MNSQWWELPWSLIDGCTPVSEACLNCWLRGIHTRFHPHESFEHVVFRKDRLNLPNKRKKPTRYAIWSDLFHPMVTDNQISLAFDVMKKNPQHSFAVLTKRPIRMANYIANAGQLPLDNVWLGTTGETMARFMERAPIVLAIPGWTHFISIEPMLEDFQFVHGLNFLWSFDWVICGAENSKDKSKKRFFDPNWARKLLKLCKQGGVRFYFKNGGTIDDPPDLCVREFPLPKIKNGGNQ